MFLQRKLLYLISSCLNFLKTYQQIDSIFGTQSYRVTDLGENQIPKPIWEKKNLTHKFSRSRTRDALTPGLAVGRGRCPLAPGRLPRPECSSSSRVPAVRCRGSSTRASGRARAAGRARTAGEGEGARREAVRLCACRVREWRAGAQGWRTAAAARLLLAQSCSRVASPPSSRESREEREEPRRGEKEEYWAKFVWAKRSTKSFAYRVPIGLATSYMCLFGWAN